MRFARARLGGCNGLFSQLSWFAHLIASLLALSLSLGTVTYGADANMPPIIAGFTPSSGPPGTLVIVTGSNLWQITQINFSSGIEAAIFGSLDDGSAVQTEVPANASTGPIQIVTAAGVATSIQDFQVESGPPSITAFEPSQGRKGTTVTFSGANLANITSVRFNGVEASFQTLAGFTAIVPDGATTGPITVVTKEGSTTTDLPFVVVTSGTPVISSFTPRSGPARTEVTIQGSNLVDVVAVYFGDKSALFTLGFFDGQLLAIVPPGASDGLIRIETISGSCVSASSFAVTQAPKPVITSLSQTSGRPGATIAIRGQNLVGTRSVQFNGVPAEFSMISPDFLGAVVPYASTGKITVQTDGGTATSTEDFTVVGGPPAPEIIDFSPSSGIDGTLVGIRGANFGTVRQVLFNGKAAAFESYGDELVATVPAFTTAGPISIVTATGVATSQTNFEAFNTGEIGVVVAPSSATVAIGEDLIFSLLVTNLTSSALEQLVLTQEFAYGAPTRGEVVVWTTNGPAFNNLPQANPQIVQVTSSQGAPTVTNGVITLVLNWLEPFASATLTVEIAPSTPERLHLLAIATSGTTLEESALGTSFTSVAVTGSTPLSVRRIGFEQIEVAWPETEEGLKLQSAEFPARRAEWIDVAAPVIVVDGRNVVLLPVAQATRFFRLVESSQ